MIGGFESNEFQPDFEDVLDTAEADQVDNDDDPTIYPRFDRHSSARNYAITGTIR